MIYFNLVSPVSPLKRDRPALLFRWWMRMHIDTVLENVKTTSFHLFLSNNRSTDADALIRKPVNKHRLCRGKLVRNF